MRYIAINASVRCPESLEPESSEAVPRGAGEEDNMGTRDRAGVRAGCNACSDARPGRESLMEKGRQHIR